MYKNSNKRIQKKNNNRLVMIRDLTELVSKREGWAVIIECI